MLHHDCPFYSKLPAKPIDVIPLQCQEFTYTQATASCNNGHCVKRLLQFALESRELFPHENTNLTRAPRDSLDLHQFHWISAHRNLFDKHCVIVQATEQTLQVRPALAGQPQLLQPKFSLAGSYLTNRHIAPLRKNMVAKATLVTSTSGKPIRHLLPLPAFD